MLRHYSRWNARPRPTTDGVNVRGKWRQLHDDELYNLYSPIKSLRMRLAGRQTSIKFQKILRRKNTTEAYLSLGDIIKMYLKEIGPWDVECLCARIL